MSEELTPLNIVTNKVNAKLTSFRKLYGTQTTPQSLSDTEKQHLSSICTHADYCSNSYKFSQSNNIQMEEEAQQILLNVLNGENLEEQKRLLTELKIRDRKNMSLPMRDKLVIAGFGSLGISGLVGVGLILGLALSLWPLAIVIGLVSFLCIGSSVIYFKRRETQFDGYVNNSWWSSEFMSIETDEAKALFLKLNSPDSQPNTKSSASSSSKKDEQTANQTHQSNTQSSSVLTQPSPPSQTEDKTTYITPQVEEALRNFKENYQEGDQLCIPFFTAKEANLVNNVTPGPGFKDDILIFISKEVTKRSRLIVKLTNQLNLTLTPSPVIFSGINSGMILQPSDAQILLNNYPLPEKDTQADDLIAEAVRQHTKGPLHIPLLPQSEQSLIRFLVKKCGAKKSDPVIREIIETARKEIRPKLRAIMPSETLASLPFNGTSYVFDEDTAVKFKELYQASRENSHTNSNPVTNLSQNKGM